MSKTVLDTTQEKFGCFSLASLLMIAFIVLKLTHYINWSWLWVISPMIIYGVLWIGLVMALFVVTVLLEITK